jgi:hypothetical protein
MRASGLSAAEKLAVTAACQLLIDDFLKPRFLSKIQPTEFNYPVDILEKWHGTKYRFVRRYRSGFPGIPEKSSTPRSPASTGSAAMASTSNGTVTPENGSFSIVASLSPKRSRPLNLTDCSIHLEHRNSARLGPGASCSHLFSRASWRNLGVHRRREDAHSRSQQGNGCLNATIVACMQHEANI